MASQKDIAQAVGLSQTAVSLALRSHPGVSSETQLRVRAAARKLGYRPDPLVAALMAQRRKRARSPFRARLAFLTGFPERDEWQRSAYASGCFRGASSAAAERGYVCEPVWLFEPGLSPRRLSRILYTRSFQGILVAPLPVDRSRVDFDWSKFAGVSLDYSLADPVLHRVVDDHAYGIERVLAETTRLGYRRPGLVLRASQDVRTHHSRLGVFLVHRSLQPGWEEVKPLILPEDRWNAALFTAWLQRERPDVVLTEEPALPAHVQQLGIRVPEQLGIAFFHKEYPARHLSGLQINSDEVGAIAAGILLRMIETNQRGAVAVPLTTLVQAYSWHPGRTLRAVR